MKQFLNDLRTELKSKGFSDFEIADIISDHEEMFQTAMNDGQSVEEILSKLGNPKRLASDLADSEHKTTHDEMDSDYHLWQSFPGPFVALNVFVKMINEDIVYRRSANDAVHILYEGDGKVSDYNLSLDGEQLRLESKKERGFFLFGHGRILNFVIEIPDGLEMLEHHGVNGDYQLLGIKGKGAKIVTTNGDMQLEDLSYDTLTWHTVNGDIDAKHLKLRQLESHQVSGDIDMTDSEVRERFYVHTVSGDIDVNHAQIGSLDIETVSGDFSGEECYPKEISFRSVSGDIDVKNRTRTEIKILNTRSISGDINIDH
jgi:DUF4097 and DUF4098 domain-containing protein YvlB